MQLFSKEKYRLARLAARRGVFTALMLIGGIIAGATSAYAAAVLTYNADTSATLTSPGMRFIIKSGSVADRVVVGAGNLTMVLSSTTGGTFVITSPLNLTIATDTGNGTVSTSCGSDSVLTTTLANTGNVSTTYTFTPTDIPCIFGLNTSGGTVSGGTQVAGGSSNAGGGGGGGGGGGLPAPTTATTTTATTATTASPAQPTVAALQAQLNTLLALLQTLIAQAQQKGIALPPGIGQITTGISASAYARNLTVGSTGNDVKNLQLFLIGKNAGPMAQKLAQNGTTTYFGNLTRAALAEYQASKGISPAVGYFGPITRSAVNAQ